MDNLTAGNPVAHRVRVYYDGSSTIAEGMPVCYNYLTTQNWYGGSVNDAGEVTASEVTAEGSHNKGKYLYVSNPICVNSTVGTWGQAAKTIDDDGDQLDNLQVNMMVSIASIAEDTDINGNYRITAVNATDNTITLGDMTDAEAAAVTDAIDDCTVKIDNLHAFAGVVAKGGWCGRTGPRVVDIYVPNGAIVPVKTVLAATVAGRTILSIVSATQTFGNPETDAPNYGSTAGQLDSRPVAIAAETVSAAGLVLAKLDDTLFIYQGGQPDQELRAGYIGTVKTAVNRMHVKFEQTSGSMCLNHWRATCAGGGTSDAARGLFRFEGFLSGTVAPAGSLWVVDSMIDLGANITDGYYSPLHLTIRSRVHDPDLSACYLAVQYMEYILTGAAGSCALANPPYMGCWFMFNIDGTGSVPDYLFYAAGKRNVCMSTQDVASGDSAANSISIWVEGEEMFIPCYLAAELI